MMDAYVELIKLLDRLKINFRIIEHSPEGRTEIVSQLRGHSASEAAKCMVVMAKIGKKVTKYILAVVPGDSLVSLAAIKTLTGAGYVTFASAHIAERLSGSVSGTILPFTFNRELELIADPALLNHEELYFNAARLDRSIVLSSRDYASLAKPRFEKIAMTNVLRSS